MSNLSCGTHVAEPSANKDCRKLLNQFCRFLPKLKLPISADAKLPLTLLRILRQTISAITERRIIIMSTDTRIKTLYLRSKAQSQLPALSILSIRLSS